VIDFRYHIVSLISVFLALAVGIVLGAGPLRGTIADELSGQVDQLRVEKEALRADLDTAQTAVQDRSSFISESAPRLLEGTLSGRSVSLVALPGADPDVTDAVAARLTQADATIAGRVQITDTWVDPSQMTFRSGIAQNLVPSMNPAPEDDAPSGEILAQALGQSLTLRDPDHTDKRSPAADQMLELLKTSELVTEDSTVDGPAYATVVVGPPARQEEPTDKELDRLEQVNTMLTHFSLGISGTGEGAIVAGAPDGPGSLLAAVRAHDEAAAKVTTVDSVGTVTGQVTIPLALAAAISGEQGHYGTSEDADAVIPPQTSLPAPDPGQFARGPAEDQG